MVETPLFFGSHIFALLGGYSKLFLALTSTNYWPDNCVDHTMPASTKNTLGKATPFPHILYSAASEWGCCSHLTIWFRLLALVELPTTRRWVSRTLATGQVAAVLIQRPGGLSFHHRRMIVSLVFLHFPVDMMGILSYIVLSISYWCHVILHQLN